MRAARDGSIPRSEASPAAASAHCHSECTSAHPSACVAVMRFLPPSIPSARCLFRVQGVLHCVWILLHWTTASCSRACTLWLGRWVRDRGLSRCSHATPPTPGRPRRKLFVGTLCFQRVRRSERR